MEAKEDNRLVVWKLDSYLLEDEGEETINDSTFHCDLMPLRPDLRSEARKQNIMDWFNQKLANGWIKIDNDGDWNIAKRLPNMSRRKTHNVERYIYWLNLYNHRALMTFNPDMRVLDDCGMNNFMNAWELWYHNNFPELVTGHGKNLFYSPHGVIFTSAEIAWKQEFFKQPRTYSENGDFVVNIRCMRPSRYYPLDPTDPNWVPYDKRDTHMSLHTELYLFGLLSNEEIELDKASKRKQQKETANKRIKIEE